MGGWRGVKQPGVQGRAAQVEAAARIIQKRVMKYLGVWYQSGGAVNSKQGEYEGSRARG
jgi:hypothetical protein